MTTKLHNAEPGIHEETAQTRMVCQLELLSGRQRARSFTVPAAGIILGRHSEPAALAGADPTVSRRHARLYFSDQGQPFIEDLTSANGTFLNGDPLSRPRSLRDQDIITIGNVELRFVRQAARLTLVDDEARQRSEDPGQLLSEGRRLLEEGQLGSSAAVFQKASQIAATAGDGHYGLGVIALAHGDPIVAEAAFSAALAADPDNNNALYQLGFLWEKRGRRDDALDAYRQVLAAQPQHASARVRYNALTTGSQQQPVGDTHSSAGQTAARASGQPVEQGPPGVLGYLMSDPTPLSRQAAALIRQLEIDTRPRYLAYLGRHPLRLFALLLTAGALVARGSSNLIPLTLAPGLKWTASRPLGFLALAVILTIYGAMYVRVACTRIRIRQGRLQIERGVFHKDLRNFDLWRVRTIRLEKTLINRITGDGTLIFALGPEATTEHRRLLGLKPTIVKVPGLAHGGQLASLYQDLLNLVFLLRGNLVVKGIIQ
jgi:pSer/pThr/pTyr-binding forkhead associated (FHA) protein